MNARSRLGIHFAVALIRTALQVVAPYLLVNGLVDLKILNIPNAEFFHNFWAYFMVGIGVSTLLEQGQRRD